MTDCWYERQDKSLAVSLTFARIKSSEAALRLGAAPRTGNGCLSVGSNQTPCALDVLGFGSGLGSSLHVSDSEMSTTYLSEWNVPRVLHATRARPAKGKPHFLQTVSQSAALNVFWSETGGSRAGIRGPGDLFTFHAQTHTHDSSDTGSALKYTQAIKSVHTPAVSIGIISVPHSITAERLPESVCSTGVNTVQEFLSESERAADVHTYSPGERKYTPFISKVYISEMQAHEWGPLLLLPLGFK